MVLIYPSPRHDFLFCGNPRLIPTLPTLQPWPSPRHCDALHCEFGACAKEKEKKKKKVKKEKVEEKTTVEDGEAEKSPVVKEEPRRAQRGTSNVFALFNQAQIQEFKEVQSKLMHINLCCCCSVSLI